MKVSMFNPTVQRPLKNSKGVVVSYEDVLDESEAPIINKNAISVLLDVSVDENKVNFDSLNSLVASYKVKYPNDKVDAPVFDESCKITIKPIDKNGWQTRIFAVQPRPKAMLDINPFE